MDIGTAKLPEAERGGVPHHLLDVWPLTKSAAVAEYQQLARAAIAEIAGRGRVPILVGGSGLYLRGALDRLEFPGESPEIRARLYAELDDARRRRRCTRRLADARPGGRGGDPAHQRPAHRPGAGGHRADRAPVHRDACPASTRSTTPSILGLDRADLDERVEQRVHRMMALGFLDEIRAPAAGRAARQPDRRQGARLRPAARRARRRRRGRRRPRRGGRDRPSAPPAGSSGGSGRGSGATRGCTGSTPRAGSARSRALTLVTMHVAEGPRHRERLRRCCLTSTVRSSSHRSSSGRCATGAPASAPTACCGSCAAKTTRRSQGIRGRGGVLHGLPQRRRLASPRCAETEFVSFCDTYSGSRLVEESAAVATRGGIVRVRSCTDGDISVQMGLPLVLADRPVATAAPISRARALAAVACPTRTSSCRSTAAELDALDLTRPPVVVPPLPDGQNVEFVVAGRRPAPAHAGARARRRRDPLLRHRDLRRGRRGRDRRRARRPTAARGAWTCPAARAGSSGTATGRSS